LGLPGFSRFAITFLISLVSVEHSFSAPRQAKTMAG
jgi:hypothetical protein